MNTALILCLSVFVTTVQAQEPKWCVKTADLEKCRNATRDAGLNVTCYGSDGSCVKDVIDGEAHMALASANDMVANVDKVRIVLAENYGLPDKTVRYYGVAVTKKGKSLKLGELKGKKSCHTGAGKTAGWNIPIGYFLRTDVMTYVDNQYKSAAEFFNESCVPGIKDKTNDQSVIDKLCELCSGTGNNKCTSKDPYADYVGAFKCMAEDAGDVAFVKQSTPGEVTAEDRKYGSVTNYQLLCKDGSTKETAQFASCNIDKRPSHAVVVANNTEDHIEDYRKTIRGANLSVLAGTLLDKGVKSLEDYDNDTKTYLGEYFDNVQALTQGPPVTTTTTTPTSDAASICSSSPWYFLLFVGILEAIVSTSGCFF